MGEPSFHLGDRVLMFEARALGRGMGWVSTRNATASPLLRQHLWAFKVAVETGLLVTGRSLLLSRQGPPIPAGEDPHPGHLGLHRRPCLRRDMAGAWLYTCLGGLGCAVPCGTDPSAQLALGMARGARQGCACLDTPGHIWAHMDTCGYTCILTCPCSPAMPHAPGDPVLAPWLAHGPGLALGLCCLPPGKARGP